MAGFGVAGMDDDAPAKLDRAARGQLPFALFQVRIEGVLAERIQREQAVVAHMPVGGMARVGGVVEHGHAEPLAFHLACVVHPVGTLAPGVQHADEAFGIHNPAAFALGEVLGEPDGKGALLGVAEGHILDCSERDAEVDDAQLRIGVEGHHAILGEQDFALGVTPFHHRCQRAGALAVFPRGAADNDAADVRLGVGRIVFPEFDAVHVVEREPQPAVMQVVAALAGHRLHGKAACDDFAGRGAQRREERLAGIAAVVECGEWLALDVDGEDVGLEANLRGQARRRGEGKEK